MGAAGAAFAGFTKNTDIIYEVAFFQNCSIYGTAVPALNKNAKIGKFA
jgi:hypothetical protein